MEAIAIRLEAIAIRLEAIATRSKKLLVAPGISLAIHRLGRSSWLSQRCKTSQRAAKECAEER